MSWARYDDELPMNRKVAALLYNGMGGAAALGLHVLANTWSRHNGTAGFIPRYVPGQLVCDPKLGERLSLLLANVGMFDTVEDGWLIHDFAEFSDPNDDGRSAAERKRDVSEKRAAAGRQGGLAKAGKSPSKPLANPKQTASNAVAQPEQTSSPVPVPVPNAGISDNDDYSDTPGWSSSVDLIAQAWAEHIASEAAVPPRNHERFVAGTKRNLLNERRADIERTAHLEQADALAVLLGNATLPPRQAWYADPDCQACEGEGLARDDDDRFGPCQCRRAEPYEALATVHQLREEIA